MFWGKIGVCVLFLILIAGCSDVPVTGQIARELAPETEDIRADTRNTTIEPDHIANDTAVPDNRTTGLQNATQDRTDSTPAQPNFSSGTRSSGSSSSSRSSTGSTDSDDIQKPDRPSPLRQEPTAAHGAAGTEDASSSATGIRALEGPECDATLCKTCCHMHSSLTLVPDN